ncbi:MAG TPA: MFS transporter [Kineosporiaceae bacterium]|nr:MFS transporter [Kineosporiaceae bacterium]
MAAPEPPSPPVDRPEPAPGARPGGRAGGVLRGGARTAAATTRATGRGARAVWRGGRRWTHARGAGESGLARMSELGFVATAGDTIIVTALAGTLFFSVSATAARDRVATSLLVTMVPFVLLAPVLGPVLDRIRGGRRYAMATTMVGRAFLAWVMADAVTGPSTAFSLYPAAFGFLLLQKAYLVTRSAAVPRVLPAGATLVTANSRISIAGVVALTVAAPIGAAVAHGLGASWALRLAFVVFATATVLAVALPERVDSSAGEERAELSGDPAPTRTSPVAAPSGSRRRRSIGPRAVQGLRANVATRWLSGFLTLFLAFRLRTEPLPGLGETASVALVVGLAAIGSATGSVLGGLVRRRPEIVVVVLLAAATVASAAATLHYGLLTVPAVAFVAGVAASLGKLGLDAVIQADVDERVRTSAFARSETVLQLAWVAGGVVGLFLPLSGRWGLGLATLVVAAATVLAAVDLSRLPRRTERGD